MRPNRKYRETLRVGCAALSLSMALSCAPLAVSAAETENAKEKAEIHWTISDAAEIQTSLPLMIENQFYVTVGNVLKVIDVTTGKETASMHPNRQSSKMGIACCLSHFQTEGFRR